MARVPSSPRPGCRTTCSRGLLPRTSPSAMPPTRGWRWMPASSAPRATWWMARSSGARIGSTSWHASCASHGEALPGALRAGRWLPWAAWRSLRRIGARRQAVVPGCSELASHGHAIYWRRRLRAHPDCWVSISGAGQETSLTIDSFQVGW